MRAMIFGGCGMAVAVVMTGVASPAMAVSQTVPQDDPYSAPDPYAQPASDPDDPAAREAALRARGETYRRALDARQTEEELRQTRALNAEIAAQNTLAANQEAAERLDYDATVLRRRIEAERAETERQIQADAVRASQEQYDRDYAAWREQVRLCQSGFREACSARPAWVRPQ